MIFRFCGVTVPGLILRQCWVEPDFGRCWSTLLSIRSSVSRADDEEAARVPSGSVPVQTPCLGPVSLMAAG